MIVEYLGRSGYRKENSVCGFLVSISENLESLKKNK